jgi:catalase
MTNQPASNELLPGREYPGKGEEKIAMQMVKMMQDQMLRFYPPDSGKKQLRQVHAKMYGCVKAEFIIEPNLTPEKKAGIFKDAKSYPAWIRFSAGDTHVKPDKKKDFRGFAIKLMNVPGKKLDPNEPDITVHDFVLMNRNIFFSKNIRQFVKILYFLTAPWTLRSLPKKIWIFISNLPTLLNGAKGKIHIKNPAERSYFSTTPYRFGDETIAVKYEVRPSPDNKDKLQNPDLSSDDYLRVNLAATLKKHELKYDFGIQFQKDPVKMPIENPSIPWSEKDSPFIKLATIRIPIQEFDTPERAEFGDNLSFNTWHCLPEHQPLGSFNRVRKIIYEEMYRFRHEHNHIKDIQPTATPDFFNDTNLSYHG